MRKRIEKEIIKIRKDFELVHKCHAYPSNDATDQQPLTATTSSSVV